MKCAKEVQFQKGRLGLRAEKSPNWKGGKVSYNSLHHWLRKWMPKTGKCAHCKTTKKKLVVACKKKYTRNFNDYMWLCYRCHFIFDGLSRNLALGPQSCKK